MASKNSVAVKALMSTGVIVCESGKKAHCNCIQIIRDRTVIYRVIFVGALVKIKSIS